jgi:F-type H+-transporting ATPase subunit gamma
LSRAIGSRIVALDAFVREYLFILLFQACAQSPVSENASRLAAIQRAEKNIEEILEELNRSFHRIRQESIDEELFEVLSGYESLGQAAPRPTTLGQPSPRSTRDTPRPPVFGPWSVP